MDYQALIVIIKQKIYPGQYAEISTSVELFLRISLYFLLVIEPGNLIIIFTT